MLASLTFPLHTVHWFLWYIHKHNSLFSAPNWPKKIIYFCLSVSSALFPAATGAWIIDMVALFDRFPVLIALLLLCCIVSLHLVTSWLVLSWVCPSTQNDQLYNCFPFHVSSTVHSIFMYFLNICCLSSVYLMRVHQMLSTGNYFPLSDK